MSNRRIRKWLYHWYRIGGMPARKAFFVSRLEAKQPSPF